MRGSRITSVILSFVLILAFVLPGTLMVSGADTEVTVVLDGRTVTFADQPPVIIDGRVLVPMRAIFGELGASIEWDGSAKTVTAVKDDVTVQLTIDSDTAFKNGKSIKLDVPAQMISDRTMVPLRFVGESLDCEVEWEAAAYRAVITSVPAEPEPSSNPAELHELTNEEKLAALPQGTPVLANNALLSGSVSGGSGMISKSTVDLSDPSVPFTQAVRFEVKQEADNVYSIQMVLKNVTVIQKNDMLMAMFYVRGISTTDKENNMAHMSVVLESTSTYDKSLSYGVDLPVNSQWQLYYVPFKSIGNYEAGGASFNIRLGYKPNVIEMGGLVLNNYGQGLDMADMPTTPLTYEGREEDAAWRGEALARIENIRKSDMEIKVVGAGGAAVEGAKVDVQMTRSAFDWGTAVGNTYLENSDATSLKVQEMLVKYFNTVTVENSLKWPRYESDRKSAVRAVNKLLELGLTPRGHCMVWDKFNSHMPSSVTTLRDDSVALQKRTMDHIIEIGTAFKGALNDWDVVNETVDNHDMRDILGDKAVADWFKQAKKVDPTAKLYINEYNFKPSFTEAVKSFKSYGAPIEGIGIQSHYSGPASPKSILKQMDDMAKLASEIKITEFDYDTEDRQLQADFTRDIMIAAYSHPACKGFIMWGFWDGGHWKNNAPLFYRDWTLKPSGKAYEDLVLHQFRTNESGTTGANGLYGVRGFHGKYEVTVTYNGKEYKQRITLEENKAGKLVFDVSKEPVPLPAEPSPIQLPLP